jgi:hypothetical protein
MAISLNIDTVGGANFGGYHLRNVGSLHVGGSALASTTLQVTGTLGVSGVSTLTGAVTFGGAAYLPNGIYIYGRNQANNAWLEMIAMETTNTVYLGSGSVGTRIQSTLNVQGATTLVSSVAITGATTMTLSGTALTINSGAASDTRLEMQFNSVNTGYLAATSGALSLIARGTKDLILGSNNTSQLTIGQTGNLSLGTIATFGGGIGVFAITNAATSPTTNPTGGGILYAEAGALKWRGSSGTVTTMANA